MKRSDIAALIEADRAAIRARAIEESARVCFALEEKVRTKRPEIGAAYGHAGMRIRALLTTDGHPEPDPEVVARPAMFRPLGRGVE